MYIHLLFFSRCIKNFFVCHGDIKNIFDDCDDDRGGVETEREKI